MLTICQQQTSPSCSGCPGQQAHDFGESLSGQTLDPIAAHRWFSGETQDSSLAAFAGELLALAGPLDPSAIAFNPACAPQTHQLSNNSNQAAAEQDSSSSRARSLLTMMIAALQLMADYLVDPDVLVIRSVQFTLRNLLATQLGRDAFAQLDAVTQGYLQVCIPTCCLSVANLTVPTVQQQQSDKMEATCHGFNKD